ncbi:glycine/sarcosine/betaine reductase complex component C subunit beta [Biomaibacter acetigenes]|nr:glycine/sarcosine/betaine reductase complex component C subunit beta [Biomaibacter acetigenes]MDN5311747.1 glycine/sarcosine/betaine reductase complex component subunit beta [Thermoanaerobacteraceae bacterium]
MTFPVISGSSYIMVHTPNIMMAAGTTQLLEKQNEKSEYYRRAPAHIRSYEDAVAYAPNQAYIGRLKPDDLKNIKRPWYENPLPGAERFGPYGEIMPEDEFYGLMAMADAFDLVMLEKGFALEIKQKLSAHPLMTDQDLARIKTGTDMETIRQLLGQGAIELTYHGHTVGCIKKAHDVDENLSAHTMLENIATKASAVLALRHLIKNAGISPWGIDYIIECSEEACGDMNQRGGGNFAKAVGEVAGCVNATGADIRGFCAGPSHALVNAAALVSAGIFKNVAVVAGGAVAKLGMNGRDHVNKGMPLLEDMLGSFGILVTANDGKNPVIRTNSIGRHTIGSGASPQAVIQSIVYDPLERLGLKATDVDKFAPELQNPEITEPAGAGDVPKANFKMIAALAVRRGEIEKAAMETFIEEHGMPGFAPTQGHIPSGVPFIGHAKELILSGKMTRTMIIGKGSLFLGRMTNLFDGISFIIEKNPGIIPEEKPAAENVKEPAKATESKDISIYLAEAFREFADYLRARGKGDGT